MILPLDPPIPVETPRGRGQAIYLIEYGPDYDLYWIAVLESSRECFTYNNRDISARISLENQGPEQGKRYAA